MATDPIEPLEKYRRLIAQLIDGDDADLDKADSILCVVEEACKAYAAAAVDAALRGCKAEIRETLKRWDATREAELAEARAQEREKCAAKCDAIARDASDRARENQTPVQEYRLDLIAEAFTRAAETIRALAEPQEKP